ncbi:dTDP-4-dehydrorhamnose 3,5-epimerase family protein [Nitrosophilus alvini]|uniref:dTDP-4-dehydrorhamnose 3,5-epimerase family protein n=1 Tax=Nitrosophilus alvini TaxID=2714855 RepID=UPI00190B9BE8|nr:dTDP-4-dehydrorhamnose 3,5-epimerase family protein [Nitrosophilus alvini]
MTINDTFIYGLKVIENKKFIDSRGSFLKIFNNETFQKFGINFSIKESYYSISKKDVIRGMHFQIPPKEHLKLVYVPKGRIIDIVVDIRKGSPTYGKYFEIELNEENGKALIIPIGLAHGFKSIENDTIVVYMQSSSYDRECDKGIKYDSFGYDWKIDHPILSERDKTFPPLNEFISPFKFGDT